MTEGNGLVMFAEPDYAELGEMGYMFADMHFHTNVSDSFTVPEAAVALARERGTGLAITDHNLIASIPKAMRAAGGVTVIPGMEVSTTDGPHILVWFYEYRDLQRFWFGFIRPRLLSCPWLALEDCPTEKLLGALEGEPCVVSAAHPMGYFGTNKGMEACIRKGYLDSRLTRMLDAYEVICGGMTRAGNLNALAAAESYGLSYTGGTDGHFLADLGSVDPAVKAHDVDGFLSGIAAGRSVVVGTEKTAAEKIRTGSESFAKFLEHAPSAMRVQSVSAGRSIRRGAKRAADEIRSLDPRLRG